MLKIAVDFNTTLAFRYNEKILISILILAAFIPRFFLAMTNHSILWPDEIFQTAEQAHRIVFGYGFIPWEFNSGARSYFLPLILAIPMKITSVFGFDAGINSLLTAKGFMVLIELLGFYYMMKLSYFLSGLSALILTGLFYIFLPMSLVFSGRLMGETISATLIVMSFYLFFFSENYRPFIILGLFLGASFLTRYQTGLIAVAFLVTQYFHPNKRRLIPAVCLGLVVVIVGGGVLDFATWGRFFNSLWVYLDYNLIQGKSESYGIMSPIFYLDHYYQSLGMSFIFIVVGVFFALKRYGALLIILIPFIGAHQFIGHKELRFLLPVLPMGVVIASVGWNDALKFLLSLRSWKIKDIGNSHFTKAEINRSKLIEQVVGAGRSPLLWVFGAGFFLGYINLSHLSSITTGNMGLPHVDASDTRSPFAMSSDILNIQMALSETNGVCGIGLIGIGEVWTGGYTYLHKDIPMFSIPFQEIKSKNVLASVNWIVAPKDIGPFPGFEGHRQWGSLNTWSRSGGCSSPPGFYSRILPSS